MCFVLQNATYERTFLDMQQWQVGTNSRYGCSLRDSTVFHSLRLTTTERDVSITSLAKENGHSTVLTLKTTVGVFSLLFQKQVYFSQIFFCFRCVILQLTLFEIKLFEHCGSSFSFSVLVFHKSDYCRAGICIDIFTCISDSRRGFGLLDLLTTYRS